MYKYYFFVACCCTFSIFLMGQDSLNHSHHGISEFNSGSIKIDTNHQNKGYRHEYLYYKNFMPRTLSIFLNDTITFQMGWYQNGFPMYIYNYCNGKCCGDAKNYYEDGKLKSITAMKDGFNNGKQIWYNKSGKVNFVRYFKDGELLLNEKEH